MKSLLPRTIFLYLRTLPILLFLLPAIGEQVFSQPRNPNRDNSVIDLNGQWLLKDYTIGIGSAKQVYQPEKMPADCIPTQIPGTVRTALLAAGDIPDPYIGYNNEKSLWVEQKEWWFFRKFLVDVELKGKWIDLVFEGTSFQGDVWLNGQSVGTLKGMLNLHSFDVSKLLKYDGENYLAVRLQATPDARVDQIVDDLTWDSPRDQLYSIAQCMYSWDWGVHAVPIGIWRPVNLRITGPARIDHLYIRSEINSSSRATCSVSLDVRNITNKPLVTTVDGVIHERGVEHSSAEFRKSVKLSPNETQTVDFEVPIKNPKLWWPNGMGDQNLYVLDARTSDGSAISDQLRSQFGIRELKLVENERIEEFIQSMKNDTGSVYHLGKAVGSYPWTFEINGKKMFAKGGNWIPDDQLLRLTHDRYDRLLKLAKEAHFNLFRVWGGGLYETDDFYDLCDEYGILAWQEFLSNRNFSKIDKQSFLDGAQSAVYRLRNHPSLTFWCGGNEFDPDDVGSKTVIDALGDLLARLDPQREFHRASPYKGDDHYWGVWHGQEPYTKYRIVRPFRSEAGVNAFPVVENFLKFTPEQYVWPPDTTYVEYHGEHNTGFLHLQKQMRYVDEFGAPTDIGDLIAKSQLYQALATSFNMEFCRSNKFRNSGLLIWQYDDIWPCISWSLVDWYGTPKAAYYFLKRACSPIHVSADYERYLWNAGETFAADVHLLNDTPSPVRGYTYSTRLLDTQGKKLAEKSGSAEADVNRSAKIGRIEYAIPSDAAGKSFFVVVELKDPGGKKVSDAVYPIAVSKTGNLNDDKDIFADVNGMAPVELNTVLARAEATFDKGGNASCSIQMTNPTDRLAFFSRVRLREESETLRTDYSDNYFSLLPGETKTVTVDIENKDAAALPGKLHFEIAPWRSPIQTIEVSVSR